MKWKRLTSGPRTIVDALNDLGEFVTRTSPIAGVGIRASEGPGGTLLEARGNGVGGVKGSHPFKISVAVDDPDIPTWTISVAEGVVNDDLVYEDADGFAVPLRWASKAIFADKTGVADDTVNGVWLVYETNPTLAFGKNETANDQIGSDSLGAGALLVSFGAAGAVYTELDPVNVEALDVFTKIAADTKRGFIYIGKVAITAGVVEIDQWQLDNVILPTMTWDHGTLSTNENNTIQTGTDGGIFYEDPDYTDPSP